MIEETRDAVSLRHQTLGYFVQKHDHGSSYLDRMNDDRRMQVATAVCNKQMTSRWGSKQVAQYCSQRG